MFRKIGVIAAVSLLSVQAIGCGGDDDTGNLDCAWIESEKNCWAQALERVQTCLPSSMADGVFDESLQLCGYESGHTVTFASPVDLPLDTQTAFKSHWKFDIAVGEEFCLGWESSEHFMAITTGVGTVRMDSGGNSVTFTCEDGKKYKSTNAFELVMTCDNPAGMMIMGDDEVHFSALGGFGEGGWFNTTSLFSCVQDDA